MLGIKNYMEMAEIGIALTAEKDENKLLDKILSKIIDITYCDSGILYLQRNGMLEFGLMEYRSLGIKKGLNDALGDSIDLVLNEGLDEETCKDIIELPPIALDDNSICAYAARNKVLLNVDNVRSCKDYDFTNQIKFDKKIKYKSKTMLILPLINAEDTLVGVIQLINAFDDEGNEGIFSQEDEYVLKTLGSQAAVAISNMMYIREMERQMNSFATAFAEAIDARTPYNGTHTKKVALYALRVANEINNANARGETDEFFDENRKEQLYLAAYLHDIGKMIVPLAVMNKATRLEKRLDKIDGRFKLIKAYNEIDYLRDAITAEEYEFNCKQLDEYWAVIKKANTIGYMDDSLLEKINKISKSSYTNLDGVEINYLTNDEIECLSIRKGTLTEKERTLMESHVKMTERILDKVYFNSQYANVKKIASAHHEYLDGSGYPHKLKAKDLGLEERILAVVDIYDALTSKDRPYKRPIPVDKAFAILGDMVINGKLDSSVVDYLGRCIDIEQ